MIEARVVEVAAGQARYEVAIGRGLLDEIGQRVRAVSDAGRVAIVSDTNVDAIFGVPVASRLLTAGFDVYPMSIAPGEASKNWQVAGELLEGLAAVGLGREDLLVALGGGVVGDLAGFAAATYLRGIDLVQVPTTLLAQVDSSVGGKTGVDLGAGKNLAGAFKPPVLVLADTQTLDELPAVEWASGMAEIVKTSVLDGETFFAGLERDSGLLARRDPEVTTVTVEHCVRFKSGVVSADEREGDMRECLNYGHTFAHAIEKVAGYGEVAHGVAVAEGMRFASRLSVQVASASREFVRRQDELLDACGLPAMEAVFPVDELLEAMQSDKKARRGVVRFVLVDSPGVWRCQPVESQVVREHLAAWADSKESG